MTTPAPSAVPVAPAAGRELAPGIYSPTITFFQDTPEQELDLDTHVKHMEFLARSGIQGVVVQGSTAEAVTLDREERKQMIRTAKEAFRRVGNPGAIIAGLVGAQSTREAILLSKDAAEAGAEFTLVLPPSYYPAWMTPAAIKGFYEEVANASPIPLIIYSYPQVCSGIDMDSDLISALAKHPNIAGVKHTDHNVGKMAREAARAHEFGSPFTILGGATDYLLGTLAVGGHGGITGMANVAPRVCAKAFELYLAGQHAEALKYAAAISKAEWAMKGGIVATKYYIQSANNYPASAAVARKPLPRIDQSVRDLVDREGAEIAAMERQLEKEGYVGSGLRSTVNGSAAAKANGANGTANGGAKEGGVNGLVQKLKEVVSSH